MIYRNRDTGPVFGFDLSDILIMDDCNRRKNSYAYFPNCYNREGANKLPANKETHRMFTGTADD